MHHSPKPLLEWLFEPIGSHEFFDRYFEKKACIVNRDSEDYFKDLLALDSIDYLLGSHTLKVPEHLTVVKSSGDIDPNEFRAADGDADILRVMRQFSNGGTIILGQAHDKIPSLRRFCTSLSSELFTRAQANIYVTPRNSQGFKPHWDTHDVIVIQISGKKEWTLYNTHIDLPLRGQKYVGDEDCIAEPTGQFTLRAGDIAYIPRGLIHSASADNETSIHITTGLISFTWVDYFLQGLSEAALNNVELRKVLPFSLTKDDCECEITKSLVASQLKLANDFILSSFYSKHFKEEVIAASPPCFGDLLAQASKLHETTSDTTVSLRPGSIFSMSRDAEQIEIIFGSNKIFLPLFAFPTLQAVLSGAPFKVKDLPGPIDNSGKINIVKRLVSEGLIQLTNP